MSPQLIIKIVLTASGFIGGWTVKSWQAGYKEKARVEQILEQQKAEAATAVRRYDTVQSAQEAATAREISLRADIAKSRSAIDRLRLSTEAAARDAAASHASCTERANTLSELLNTMAAAGGELGEKADRHANDARTCHDAWPK